MEDNHQIKSPCGNGLTFARASCGCVPVTPAPSLGTSGGSAGAKRGLPVQDEPTTSGPNTSMSSRSEAQNILPCSSFFFFFPILPHPLLNRLEEKQSRKTGHYCYTESVSFAFKVRQLPVTRCTTKSCTTKSCTTSLSLTLCQKKIMAFFSTPFVWSSPRPPRWTRHQDVYNSPKYEKNSTQVTTNPSTRVPRTVYPALLFFFFFQFFPTLC